MSSPSAAFSTPLGPLHNASPSVSPSLLSFFKPSKAPTSAPPATSRVSISYLSPLDSFTSRKPEKSATASTYSPVDLPPPTYGQAVGLEEALEDRSTFTHLKYVQTKASEEVERKIQAWSIEGESERERLLRRDREMAAALAMMGI